MDREEWTVKCPPTVVATFEDVLDRVVKIVGVSDDHDMMARCIFEHSGVSIAVANASADSSTPRSS